MCRNKKNYQDNWLDAWLPRGFSVERVFRDTDDAQIALLCDRYSIAGAGVTPISAINRSQILGDLRGYLASVSLRDRIIEDMIYAYNQTPANSLKPLSPKGV